MRLPCRAVLRVARRAGGAAVAAVRSAWPARLLCLLLIGAVCSPRAWDAGAMLQAAPAHGPQAVAGARLLQAVLADATGRDDAGRLAAINDFFNRRIAFASDDQVWGQPDYWASPLETLGKGRGDCEDYVIAKYFGLLVAGVPVAKLRLVYARATVDGQVLAHMVLAYHAAPGAEPLILDNLVDDIRPASRRPDLAPIFSFNSEGLWQGTGSARAGGDPLARLSRWREVLAKARAEGFQ